MAESSFYTESGPDENPTLESLEGLTLSAGDLLYATGNDSLTNLAIGTTGQVLTVDGDGLPAWDDPGAVAIDELDDIGDVTITSVQDGDVLTWDEGESKWVNGAISGSGITEVVEDTSPTLGGALDAADNDINMGSGDIVFDSELRIYGSDAAGMLFWLNAAASPAWTFRYELGGLDAVIIDVNGNVDIAGDVDVGDDLLLSSSGSVINWNSGDLTLTHSANTLTLAGGTLVLPAAGLTVGASTPFSDSAGTLTLQNVDALDATTESTIEAAIDTLANLTSVQGRTVTLTDAGADAFFGWDDSVDTYEVLSAAEAIAILATADGTGSGLDADLLDGNEASVFSLRGKQTIWIPAGAMTSRTTSGAESTTREINSITLHVLKFDTSADEGANFSVVFPKSWNASTVTFRAHWTAASGSGTVEFELRGGSFANDAAINVSGLGTAVAASDTLIAADDVHITSESSAITLSNAADSVPTFFEIIRDVSDDTLGVDAELIGIELFYTTDLGNDA